MKKYLSILLITCFVWLFSAACSDGNVPRTDGGVDLDLTAMSNTLIYAEVYNITTTPNNYLGKTIKMSGTYTSVYNDETGKHYNYVIVEDVAECCQQGLEFIWNGEHTYPDDYLEDKTKIEVTGVFRSYMELDRTYYYLAVDDITIL